MKTRRSIMGSSCLIKYALTQCWEIAKKTLELLSEPKTLDQLEITLDVTCFCLQTSFILGEPAGRRDTGGPHRGLQGLTLTRDQAQQPRQQPGLPLPATMLCCGGKKVTIPALDSQVTWLGDVLCWPCIVMADLQFVGECSVLDLAARHNVRITMSLAGSCCATTNQVWSVWLRSPARGLSENQRWLSGSDGWQLLVTSLVTVDLLANSQRSQRNLNTKLRPSYNHITDPASTLARKSHQVTMGHSKSIIFDTFLNFYRKSYSGIEAGT